MDSILSTTLNALSSYGVVMGPPFPEFITDWSDILGREPPVPVPASFSKQQDTAPSVTHWSIRPFPPKPPPLLAFSLATEGNAILAP